MIFKPYSKSELALMYFPGYLPNLASARLTRWIHQCEPLMAELRETDYKVRNRIFTVRQVRIIVRHLGEPGAG